MKKEAVISLAHGLINTGCVLPVTSAYKDKKVDGLGLADSTFFKTTASWYSSF